ncbi:hypothetical protein X777_04779 [Ooceraea biroi]|uniref:Uncharacterized protein n=1 Tax=Ooceraea biroi TaxID=2015173 RepID=A0A026WI25_OOCBI|nr:hypothetical protein X777_04779 [Ooceraea biroi]
MRRSLHSRGLRHFPWNVTAYEGSSVLFACVYVAPRVCARVRGSARGRNCRNNTVPEVANGWPVRLFEMEVSNSRVK